MTVRELLEVLQAASPSTLDEQVILIIEPEDENDLYYTANLVTARKVHDILPWEDDPRFCLQLQGRDGQ